MVGAAGTGATTATWMRALRPSQVARSHARPGARAVSSPAGVTVAMVSSSLVHTTGRSRSGASSAPRGVATSWCVAPTSNEAAGATACTTATAGRLGAGGASPQAESAAEERGGEASRSELPRDKERRPAGGARVGSEALKRMRMGV
jgi:hypothetical protein